MTISDAFLSLGMAIKYYAWVKPAGSSKGLNWPFHRFSGGLLWMQHGIPAMARSGGNTVLYNLGSIIVLAISNRSCALGSSNFEITRGITP